MWGVNITLDFSHMELNASFWDGVSLSNFSFSNTSSPAPATLPVLSASARSPVFTTLPLERLSKKILFLNKTLILFD